MKTCLLMLASITLICGCSTPSVGAESPKKLLVVTTTAGFRHSSIPTAEKVIAQIAERTGEFTVDFVRQPEGKPTAPKTPNEEAQAIFREAQAKWETQLKQALLKLSPESLKNYDGVIFANTTGDLPIPDKEGFLAWLSSGKAFIGMHAATDTFPNWPGYIDMIGGHFLRHGSQVGVDCCIENTMHPATTHLGKVWPIQQEEIYLFKNYDPARVKELIILEKHPNDKTPGRYPISWTREMGKGKIFYTSLGHREDIWDTDPTIKDRKNSVEISQAYQAHISGGIRWALGLKN
ncbi:MAG: ThuA domain-containing protein [Akkermansiaceae bacterium]|nr:ThuA domain-containing protein [Verrucomicrobiales bacterium]